MAVSRLERISRSLTCRGAHARERARSMGTKKKKKKKERNKKKGNDHANDHHHVPRPPRAAAWGDASIFNRHFCDQPAPRPAAGQNANSRIGSEISGQTWWEGEGGREGERGGGQTNCFERDRNSNALRRVFVSIIRLLGTVIAV